MVGRGNSDFVLFTVDGQVFREVSQVRMQIRPKTARLFAPSAEGMQPEPLEGSSLTVSDLSLPAKYWDLADMFDKKGEKQLPPHHSYDCLTDVVSGTQIPFGHIPPQTRTQGPQGVYQGEPLKGFIRPSMSPPRNLVFLTKEGWLASAVWAIES